VLAGSGDPVVLTGDLVGDRASRAILGPPDEAAWSRSLERIRALRPARLYPGHGEPIEAIQ
jgi:glyoxylase-like metal-dependent hydrolase (beta-lactamase superfamily II)